MSSDDILKLTGYIQYLIFRSSYMSFQLPMTFSGWWFGTFFTFHILGIVIPIDSYFSEGWLSHQPV